MGNSSPDRRELARQLFENGRTALERGDYLQAAEMFSESNRLIPHHVAQQLEAKSRFHLLQFEEALNICNAIQAHRHIPGTELLRVQCLSKLERWAEVIKGVDDWREQPVPKVLADMRRQAESILTSKTP